MENKDFTVLIIGSDINAYYMARCFHELYGIKVDMVSKYFSGATKYTSFINPLTIQNNNEGLLDFLNSYSIKIRITRI